MGRSGKKAARGGYSLLLKDSVIYGAGRALQKFLVALLLPLYTAFLSQSDYGILGMVVTVTTLLDVIITLGFDVAFTRFYFDDKTEETRRRVITTDFYVKTVYPFILLSVLIVLMPQIAPVLLGGQYSDGDWVYFAVGLSTLWFSNLNDLPFTLFRMEHKPWTFSAYTIGRVFVQVPLSVVFVAVFDWGPMGVLLANLITAAGMQAGLLPTYIRKVDWRLHWDLMKSMLAFAIPALFTGLSFYWLKLSDRYFLLHYQGKAEVGLYTVANSLAQPLYLVLMGFRMAWPQWHFAKLGDPERHKHMVARSSTYFIALNGLALVLMGAYLPFLVHTFLNHRYWSVGPTTFVLTLSIVLYALYFVFWVGSNVAKKNRMIPVFFAVASGVNIALNFWLVPHYGMWAAAWTTVAGYGILVVTVYFYAQHWYPIPYEWARLLKVLAATVGSLAAVWAIAAATGLRADLPIGDLVVRTLLVTPALAIFPLVLWLTGFFTPGERQRIDRLWSRLRRRPAPQAGTMTAAVTAGAGAVIRAEGDETQAAWRDGRPEPAADVDEMEDDETEAEVEAGFDLTEGNVGGTV